MKTGVPTAEFCSFFISRIQKDSGFSGMWNAWKLDTYRNVTGWYLVRHRRRSYDNKGREAIDKHTSSVELRQRLCHDPSLLICTTLYLLPPSSLVVVCCGCCFSWSLENDRKKTPFKGCSDSSLFPLKVSCIRTWPASLLTKMLREVVCNVEWARNPHPKANDRRDHAAESQQGMVVFGANPWGSSSPLKFEERFGFEIRWMEEEVGIEPPETCCQIDIDDWTKNVLRSRHEDEVAFNDNSRDALSTRTSVRKLAKHAEKDLLIKLPSCNLAITIIA